jgi:class 3 adenylate cyclase
MKASLRSLFQPRHAKLTWRGSLGLAVATLSFVVLFFATVGNLGQQATIFGFMYVGFVAWFRGIRWGVAAYLVCTYVYSQKLGEATDAGNIFGMLIGLGEAVVVGFVSNLYAKLKETQGLLEAEHQKSEMILGNIFPKRIVERLKDGEVMIADRYLQTTLLFSDLVGFTSLTRIMSPAELVSLLDHLITGFDQLSEKLHIEKIKTIGDAYMVVSGLPTENPHHARDICNMALAMQDFLHEFNQREGLSLQIRIGINSGAVIGGVIGPKKFTFDLWGDTVNLASRLESTGIPSMIHVSQSTYELTRDLFRYEPRPPVEIKGYGMTETYFLMGPKTEG